MPNQTGSQKWDPRLYDDRHGFVWKHGAGLLDMLAAKPGERVLDLGCGTGRLTAEIAATGASVVGIDSSSEMVEQARGLFQRLDFRVADARRLEFDNEFGAVFSNAVLHWIPEADQTAASVYRALKPGGRFVAEFGGSGNVSRIVSALVEELRAQGLSDPERLKPWYYPTVGEYASLLESQGFRVETAVWFERMTALEGGDGMREWLRMFAGSFLSALPAEKQEDAIAGIEGRLRSWLYFDGAWHADYKRLRIVARKPDDKERVSLG